MLECFVVIFEKSFLFEKGKNQWWVRWFAVFIFLFKILKIITQKLLWRIVYGPWETPYVFGCFRKLLKHCGIFVIFDKECVGSMTHKIRLFGNIVIGVCMSRVERIFWPNLSWWVKKIQPNPTHHISSTQSNPTHMGRVEPVGLTKFYYYY